MSDGGGIRSVALVCPGCGDPIRAPRGDVLFACAGCGATSEATEQGLRVLPHAYHEPAPSAPDPDIWLPVWCFKVDVSYEGEDGDVVALLSEMVRPDVVYVPAFRQRSTVVFGDMGLIMTWGDVELRPGGEGRFAGATLGSREAARLVEPSVMWRADQVRDITGIEVETRIGGVKVVGVPATDEDGIITDLTRGRQWPEAAFLDVDSLRFPARASGDGDDPTCGRR